MPWTRKKSTTLCNLSTDNQRKIRSLASVKQSKVKNPSFSTKDRAKILRDWNNGWFKKG